jgi:hypothetical protein
MKKTFIAWTRFHQRSELLAKHLGATIHYIYCGQQGKLLQLPVRYSVQAWQTWHVLRRDRPDVVFVQNPTIISVLFVFLYAMLYGARYVIDSHTGAFIGLKWRWSLGLHRLLSSKALLTIVHNKSQEKIVRRWGCPYSVVAFTPGDYSFGEDFPLNGHFNVAVIRNCWQKGPITVTLLGFCPMASMSAC